MQMICVVEYTGNNSSIRRTIMQYCVCVGMLGAFFQTLYDSNVISDDAFIQWDKSEDSAERNGSGVAKKSVVQFITWLQEVDDEAAEG